MNLTERLDKQLQSIKEDQKDLQILRNIPDREFSKEFLNAIISCLTSGRFIFKPELIKVCMKYYTDEIDYLIYHKDDDDRDLKGVLSGIDSVYDDWGEGVPGSIIPEIIRDYKNQLSPSMLKELDKASYFIDGLGYKLYPKAVQYAKNKWGK